MIGKKERHQQRRVGESRLRERFKCVEESVEKRKTKENSVLQRKKQRK